MLIQKIIPKAVVSEVAQRTGNNDAELGNWAMDDKGDMIVFYPNGDAELWDALQQDWVPLEVNGWAGRNDNGYFVVEDRVKRAEYDVVSSDST